MNFDDFNDQMMRDGFNYFGEDEQTAWSNFRNRFATMQRGERVAYIKNVDSYLVDGMRPTKESASVWRKKRELIALNDDLVRLGR